MQYFMQDMAAKTWLQMNRSTITRGDKIAAVGAVAFVILFFLAIWLH